MEQVFKRFKKQLTRVMLCALIGNPGREWLERLTDRAKAENANQFGVRGFIYRELKARYTDLSVNELNLATDLVLVIDDLYPREHHYYDTPA